MMMATTMDIRAENEVYCRGASACQMVSSITAPVIECSGVAACGDARSINAKQKTQCSASAACSYVL